MRKKITTEIVTRELNYMLDSFGKVYSGARGEWIPIAEASKAEIRKDLLDFSSFYPYSEADNKIIDDAIKTWMEKKGFPLGTKNNRTPKKEMQKDKEKSTAHKPNENSASSRAVSWFWRLVVFVGRVRFGDSKKD